VRLEVSPLAPAKFAEQRKRVPGELAAPPHPWSSWTPPRYLFGAAGSLAANGGACLYGALDTNPQRLIILMQSIHGDRDRRFDASKYLIEEEVIEQIVTRRAKARTRFIAAIIIATSGGDYHAFKAANARQRPSIQPC
jgi:hypothetical protein